MDLLRFRSAVSPLRRGFDPPRHHCRGSTTWSRPCGRRSRCTACVRRRSPPTARDFVGAFPGEVLYAVKCNPEPAVLRALWAGGVRHFDCASPAEVALVRQMFSDARDPFHAPGEGARRDPRGLGAARCARLCTRYRR